MRESKLGETVQWRQVTGTMREPRAEKAPEWDGLLLTKANAAQDANTTTVYDHHNIYIYIYIHILIYMYIY